MSNIFLGDKVKVIDQDITGIVVEIYHSTLVIEDDCCEFEAPDNRLEYRFSEVTACIIKTLY